MDVGNGFIEGAFMKNIFAGSTKRRTSILALTGLSLTAAAVGVFLGGLQVTGNFHTVIAGEIYRSAQPSPSDIARYSRTVGIRTIVNLRGPSAGKAWYDRELAESHDLGITHIDFRMSATHEFTQDKAVELLALLQDAPKPILIHCEAGADRSGLVSALYVAAVGKLGEAAAESQMSVWYGHIGLPFSASYAMDVSFENLEPWLGYHDS
jgi:protein tyrosine/serine phosphatase